MDLQKVISKKLRKMFFLHLEVNDKYSRIRGQRYGSADPDAYQYVTDPQHCKIHLFKQQMTLKP
jgi:hypothetical protein